MSNHRLNPRKSLVTAAAGLCIWIAASPLARAEIEMETASRAADPEFSTETATDEIGAGGGFLDRFSVNYTNIFYGPAISGASSLQPDSNGNPDENRPVYMKNFLSASYGITDNVAATGTFYFQYRPVLGQEFTVMDPFARVSHASIFSTDWGLNLYSDARVHFGVTDASRQADFITGFQNFSYLSWEIARSRLTMALRGSARYNVYGNQGQGVDAEFYVAPEAIYQVLPTLAVTVLYEMGASHQFGDDATFFTNDGTDLQPGVSWDITPNLNFNPYLNLYTGGKVSAASTSVGAFLSWNLM